MFVKDSLRVTLLIGASTAMMAAAGSTAIAQSPEPEFRVAVHALKITTFAPQKAASQPHQTYNDEVQSPPPAPVANRPGPPPSPPLGPSPIDRSAAATPNDVQRWGPLVSSAYPAEALAAGMSGSVGVNVTVNEQGRVRDCSVTQSSGHSVLDEAACRAMKRYAEFNPARNRSGDPTLGRYSLRITYK
ncbi:MAG: energy transducer TonB [Pseudomonadota bacterium]